MAQSRQTARRRTPRQSRGSAVVELAICLPLIVVVVFGSLEACTMIFLQQSLSAAAYEGARLAARPKATNADVDQRIDEVLEARQVTAYTVVREPADIESLDRGSYITVRTSAECNANAMMNSWFFGGRTLNAQCTMVKE